MKIYSRNSVIP